MLSGMGAEYTGALYMRPTPQRSFNIKYNYSMLSETLNFKPIWDHAIDNNKTIGLMNIPTTFPAQPVKGFYIAGGGGGIFQGGIPDGAIYPESSRNTLSKNNYVFDTRLGVQNTKFTSVNSFCEHISVMMKRRTRSYIDLAKQHQIDFGFIAYRATTSLFYLAMSEIMSILHAHKAVSNSWKSDNDWYHLVSQHLKILDECLEELFNELQPSNYIITSDHSIVPWTHNVDFNGFLAENNLADLISSPLRSAKNICKLALKANARRDFSGVPLSKTLKSALYSGCSINSSSRAFSGRYVYGIYVNDVDRFDGPVNSENINETVDEIVETFNWSALCNSIRMKAVPYREKFKKTPFCDYLPDVFIEQDGHAFPSSLGPHWYSKNVNFGPIKTLKGCGGMHSGQKGTKPILMVNPELNERKREEDSMDLRLVYQLTQRLFTSF